MPRNKNLKKKLAWVFQWPHSTKNWSGMVRGIGNTDWIQKSNNLHMHHKQLSFLLNWVCVYMKMSQLIIEYINKYFVLFKFCFWKFRMQPQKLFHPCVFPIQQKHKWISLTTITSLRTLKTPSRFPSIYTVRFCFIFVICQRCVFSVIYSVLVS